MTDEDDAFRQELVLFEITPRCNLRCSHCYNIWARDPSPGDELPPEELKNLVARVVEETRCRQVTFTGGEPLLRDDLEDLIRLVDERGVASNVITNGTLVDDDRARSILRAGCRLFELPLASHQRIVHDEMSRIPGSFDRVTEAIATVRLYGGEVVVVVVLTRKNVAHVEETIRLAVLLGAQGIMLNRFNPGGRGIDHWQEILPTVDEMAAALEAADRLSGEMGIGVSCSIVIQPCLIDLSKYENLNFGYCAAGTDRSYLTVGPTGDLRPCNHTSRVMGNLFEHSFEELARGEALRDFAAARASACEGCKMEYECMGGCKAAAQECFQHLTDNDPWIEANLDRVRKLT